MPELINLYSLAKEYGQKPHSWIGLDTSDEVGKYWAWCVDQACAQVGYYEHRRLEEEAKENAGDHSGTFRIEREPKRR